MYIDVYSVVRTYIYIYIYMYSAVGGTVTAFASRLEMRGEPTNDTSPSEVRSRSEWSIIIIIIIIIII